MNTKNAARAAIRRIEMELRIIRAQDEYASWRKTENARLANPLRNRGEEYR